MKCNKETAIALVVLFLFSSIGVVDGAVNLISNPGYESGTTSWNFYTSGIGTFIAVPPGYEGTNSAKVALTSSAVNIQLFQTGVALEANTRYRLSFAAYSNTGHDVTVRLIRNIAPYNNYMPDYIANLSTSWQIYTTEFNTSSYFSGTVNDGRLMFWIAPFATAGDNYYIDAIVLEKVGTDSSPPTVTGNTPTGTGVPVTTQITVTFNESMNQASAQLAFSTSPATTGSFSWSGNMMTYTQDSSLSAGTTYTVTIGTGARDSAGNNLQTPYIWQFTTIGAGTIEARLAALEANMTSLKAENTALKNLLANVTRNGSDIYIDGANLHIRDGSGDTGGPVNGLGNLIIGYNEPRFFANDVNNRTGSHNLVLGSMNNYRSYGGLVAGYWNEISESYASVSGGARNIASGDSSSVSGGRDNLASGYYSSVSGGEINEASAWASSVSGGENNLASGSSMYASSWVGGGVLNTANGNQASVSGGYGNIASGSVSSVSGGFQRNATFTYNWAAGGLIEDH